VNGHVLKLPVLYGLVLALACFSVSAAETPADQPADAEDAAEEAEEQEIVVTATRLETPAREVASSVTVVTREEIERRQKKLVSEVLRDVPGLDVVRSGGRGQQTSVFIRGAKSEHTLVLIDGVEANDPISPGRSFNFADLTTDNVERIEIIRGPQSTLYGSDAIGGVINIITRRGKGKPTGTVLVEGGSCDTYRESASLLGGTELLNYSLSLSHLQSRGVSAADSRDGNRERDGYENAAFSARLGLTPTENFGLDLVLRYMDTEGDFDNFGGAFGDDPNSTFDTQMFFSRLQGKLALCDGIWEQTMGVSFSDYDRRLKNDVDPLNPTSSLDGDFEGEIVKFDWQHNFYVHESNTLTFGLETEEERGRSRSISMGPWGPFVDRMGSQSARTNSAYLQDQISLGERLFTTLGVRLDNHEFFDSEVTYRIAPAYLIEETGTKLKATYGTGFKAPSLYQLFSQYGDPDLDPEMSRGWDAGFEQNLCGDRVTVGATYFENRFKDLIDFGPAFTFVNVARARSEGVELFAACRPAENLAVRVSLTHQDTEDETTGEDLIRRPKNKASVNVDYRCLDDRANVNLNVSYVGSRDDWDFAAWPATRADLDSYTLVNVALAYDVTERVQLIARVENLLDRKYEEALGYGNLGLGVYAGVKVRL